MLPFRVPRHHKPVIHPVTDRVVATACGCPVDLSLDPAPELLATMLVGRIHAASRGGRRMLDRAATSPPPPFDPECAAVLEGLPAQEPLTAESIPRLRQAIWEDLIRLKDDDLTRGGKYSMYERLVVGPAGAPRVPLLICRPFATTSATPCLYSTHGGGMVAGNNREGLVEVMMLAEQVGAAVISVEYRLAPETPHPGPVEDCYAGLVWTSMHVDELNISVRTASSWLAAIPRRWAGRRTCPACSRPRAPMLLGQLLMSPMLDDRNDTRSAYQMTHLPKIWNRDANEFSWTALLGAATGGPDVSPYAAPARASDFACLPPAFLDVGSADAFRDEGITYASSIWRAGGAAELHVWPGGFHGSEVIASLAAISQAAVNARLDWLGRLLAE